MDSMGNLHERFEALTQQMERWKHRAQSTSAPPFDRALSQETERNSSYTPGTGEARARGSEWLKEVQDGACQ